MGFDTLIQLFNQRYRHDCCRYQCYSEREKYWTSLMCTSTKALLVVRKDNTTIHNMDELAGKTVGVQTRHNPC